MGYPVRLLSGTDNVMIPGDKTVYHVGDVIPNMSDETRLSLQRSGVRFEAVHEDTPPMPGAIDVEPVLPEDQQTLNETITQADKTAPAKKEKA
jgi:hypothetical protein